MDSKNLGINDNIDKSEVSESSNEVTSEESTVTSLSSEGTDLNRKDRRENEDLDNGEGQGKSGKIEIESSNDGETRLNFVSSGTVKFDLSGGNRGDEADSKCGENDDDESHDEQMVSLEEAADYSSQNNEEYFSAKEFNFGVDSDETADEIKKIKDESEEQKMERESADGKSKCKEKQTEINDHKTTGEIKSNHFQDNTKNNREFTNTSDVWDSKITDQELAGAEPQTVQRKSDSKTCQPTANSTENNEKNKTNEMPFAEVTKVKNLVENYSLSPTKNKSSSEKDSAMFKTDESPVQCTLSGIKDVGIVENDSAALKKDSSLFETTLSGTKDIGFVEGNSAILKKDVSSYIKDVGFDEKNSAICKKDESTVQCTLSGIKDSANVEYDSAIFKKDKSLIETTSSGMKIVEPVKSDAATLKKEILPSQNVLNDIKDKNEWLNLENNRTSSKFASLNSEKPLIADSVRGAAMQHLTKPQRVDSSKKSSEKSIDDFNFPTHRERKSETVVKPFGEMKDENDEFVSSSGVNSPFDSKTDKFQFEKTNNHFNKIGDQQKDSDGVEGSSMSKVASITTSVIDFPYSDRIFSSIPEQDEDLKNSLDSLENDSLNSVGYNSNGSNESIDKINAKNTKVVIPSIVVSQEELTDRDLYCKRSPTFEDDRLTGDNERRNNKISEFSDVKSCKNNNKKSSPIEIQTCGKCDQSIIRQIEQQKKYDLHKDTNKTKMLMQQNNNKLTNDISKDDNYLKKDNIFMIKNGNYQSKNGSYNGAGYSRSPRGSEQYEDGLTITDVSPEKRGSIFAKMSTLPLDGSDGFGKRRNSRKPYLLDDENVKFDWKKLLAQVLAVSAKNTLALNFGMSIGFQTIAIPSLSKKNDDLYLDENQISLFGSLFFTVIPLGCLLSGPTIHGWGRKPAMLVFCLPLFVGWWIYYVANTPTLLYLAILIMGLVNGLLEAPILTYVAEVTEARWRGMLASSSIVAALFGVFLQLLFGNWFSWRTAAAVNSAFPILSFVTICFVPESPHWLAGKGRVHDVEKSLMWLRGWTTKESVAEEVASLMTAHSQPKVAATPLAWKAYASRTFIEPFLLVLASFAIGHFSGMATVQTYSVSIFDDFGVSGWSWTAAMGATQVLGALACVIALPLIGKRPIASLAMLGVALGMAGAATARGTLAASALLLANFCTNACSRVVPWVLIGEVFTNEMRAVASGLSSCIGYAIGFVMSFTYLRLVSEVTLRGLLGIYAGFGLIGALAYYFYLPETEGKSLAEVQQYFARKNNDDTGKRNGMDNPAFERDKP